MPTKLSQTIIDMLEAADNDTTVIPPTLLYNEGWMLRSLLASAARGMNFFPFGFDTGSRWFSEAQLYSAFEPRFRGDPAGETKARADGIVGQFVFTPGSKTGLALAPECTQFVVLEAKMFAGLSKGTKNAPGFDQAARTVACMAETIRRANTSVDRMSSLAFYVVAPESQIGSGVHAELVTAESIRRKVHTRVAQYDGAKRADLDAWVDRYFNPLLVRITIGCMSWESIIERLTVMQPSVGEATLDFYSKTLRFNLPAS